MADTATNTPAVGSLDSFLARDDSPEPTGSAEPVAAEETAPSADKTEKTDATGTTAADTGSAQPEVPKGYVPVQALQDERQKRQDLELRLARLEGKIEGSAPKPTTPEQTAEETFWDNPEKFVATMDARLQKRIDESVAAAQQAAWNDRAKRCEVRARKRYTDYDAIVGEAMEKSKADPMWAKTLRDTEEFQLDPAEAVYQAMKTQKEAKAFDPAAERAKIKAELLAELKVAQGNKPLPTMPKSQAGAISAPPNDATEPDEDSVEAELFRRSY